VPIWRIRRSIFDFWQALALLRATLSPGDVVFSQGDSA
jgi:hypothetical protein